MIFLKLIKNKSRQFHIMYCETSFNILRVRIPLLYVYIQYMLYLEQLKLGI